MLSRRAVNRSSLFAVVEVLQCSENPYLVPERKLGFFVKIKEDENFNHRNTGSISRIKI
jgi:hypothetical protein